MKSIVTAKNSAKFVCECGSTASVTKVAPDPFLTAKGSVFVSSSIFDLPDGWTWAKDMTAFYLEPVCPRCQ